MQLSKEIEPKAFKLHSLFYSFAIIVVLLMVISLINITVRGLFNADQKESKIKIKNQIYDPDRNKNWTAVCPIIENISIISHALKWGISTCSNKTLLHWHIPWIRAWVWKKFNDITEERKRLKQLEKERRAEELRKLINDEEVLTETEGEEKIVDEDTVAKDLNKSAANMESKRELSSVAYTALSFLVLMSAIVAGIEFIHDKFGKKGREESGSQERRCSLAEFTMNKHLRKESHETLQRQGAFDEPRKVNRFLHQGSLDRAITRLSTTVTSGLPRQNSVPLGMTAGGASDHVPILATLRNPSIDTSEEERSPNARRKSRHFIRRH